MDHCLSLDVLLSLIEHTVQLRHHLLDLPLNEAVKGEFEKSLLRQAKIDDFERLCPEELNQQNIEALVAENNLILPVNDVNLALHNFVYKDDKMSFYSCVQYNLEETHVRAGQGKVSALQGNPTVHVRCSVIGVMLILLVFLAEQNITSKGTAETGSAVSFSDDEDLSRLSGSKSTTRGRSSSSATFKSSHDASEHGKDSYRCILHREVLVQPLIEMLHYADVQLREMSSFALGRLA
ncbi:Double-strand break repair protein MRE11 [Vitis vinifera]|uniref:Double-strand break repair protein MRE11 n=1 Tax=Vitis vinifera TaxID=29760 RepID=A0A438DAD8_VITVI|nr:Double-strand break repair protein MRE11 [Vitis vinifera]